MAEFKIESVFAEPAKEWKGPHGTVFYKTVMIDGHDKPVSVGKKDPDVLTKGDIIYGDIVPTDYIEDKFKPSPPPEGQSEGSSKPSGDKYLKDTSDLPYRVWKDMLPFMDVQDLVKDADYNRELNEYVIEQANELLKLIENVRGSDE